MSNLHLHSKQFINGLFSSCVFNICSIYLGYDYKRLYEHVPLGIYECNSNCKCKSNCLNRVVQEPLKIKLQVFKTVRVMFIK